MAAGRLIPVRVGDIEIEVELNTDLAEVRYLQNQVNAATAHRAAVQENYANAARQAQQGLLAHLDALEQLADRDSLVAAAQWLLFALFALLGCAPIIVRSVKVFGSYNADEKILREQELADIQLASQHEITREVLAARARIERAKVFAWEEEALRRIAAGQTPEPPEGQYKADPVIASTSLSIDRGPRRQMLNGENCIIFLTDVAQFGSRSRNDRDRLIIRRALLRIMQAALQGMPNALSEDRGDGLITVIPPTVSTEEVMEQFLRVAPRELERHNSSQPDSGRIQLRVAVNVGPVVEDDAGVSGEAIITAARLVEAPAFKEALARSMASLGVIASPFVYETALRHSQESDYIPTPVKEKNFTGQAWMKIFGPEQSSRRSRGDGVIALRGRGRT